MKMAGLCTPHFLFSVAPKRENGPCTVQKRKGAGGENLPIRANFAQGTGAGLNRCPGELPAFCRVRLTAYRPLALRRICWYHRGCFGASTHGLPSLPALRAWPGTFEMEMLLPNVSGRFPLPVKRLGGLRPFCLWNQPRFASPRNPERASSVHGKKFYLKFPSLPSPVQIEQNIPLQDILGHVLLEPPARFQYNLPYCPPQKIDVYVCVRLSYHTQTC